MTDQPPPDIKAPDPVAFAAAMTRAAERSQWMMQDFLNRQGADGMFTGQGDPLNVGQAFLEMTTRLMTDPTRLWEAQMSLWQDYMTLWQSAALKMMGQESAPVITPPRGDRRFKDEAWEENALFDFIKQSYLLTARWMRDVVNNVEGLDADDRRKVDFYTRQFADAMAPSNFVLTNPEVLRTTLETGGENLIKGLNNLLDDLERGDGRLKISMTDTEAFTVGENLAITPGKVVYENRLMQLIQYTPQTETVARRPLLIVPPWINKYYILDLRPKNSFIRYAVSQGLTVFTISWVNPDAELAQKTFEDYMREGVLDALSQVEARTGEHEINTIGYCLGGTLLAATLAYMKAHGDHRITSATFFTTLLDFENAGELKVFIDEEQVAALEERMSRTGYLEGADMATTFNLLRSNDLIWTFVVNNYLLGKEPFPFDLLFWNQDSTRMPAAMHSYYLRKMYLENRLKDPGGLTLLDTPIDLRDVDLPVYMLSTKEDHIAPWCATYAATQMFQGPMRFVLAASGHIAGVINPPEKNKYCYWVREDGPLPEHWEGFLEGTTEHPGSWWPDWTGWLAQYSGGDVPARSVEDGLEDAPGRYVTVGS